MNTNVSMRQEAFAMLLVAKLHLDPRKIKEKKVSSLSVTSASMFFSVSSVSPWAEETMLYTTQKSMWDFNAHTFINMQLPTRSYWVKCWVTFELSEKPRKTSYINKSMQTTEAQSAPTVAG